MDKEKLKAALVRQAQAEETLAKHRAKVEKLAVVERLAVDPQYRRIEQEIMDLKVQRHESRKLRGRALYSRRLREESIAKVNRRIDELEARDAELTTALQAAQAQQDELYAAMAGVVRADIASGGLSQHHLN